MRKSISIRKFTWAIHKSGGGFGARLQRASWHPSSLSAAHRILMAENPTNSNGGQPVEAAAATPGAESLFRTQNRFLGRPTPRSPSNRLVAAAQPVPTQGARRPRPRSRRRSPTRTISSSSEARAAPECPLLEPVPIARVGGGLDGWAGRTGCGVGGEDSGVGGVTATRPNSGLGRPTGPTIDHKVLGGGRGAVCASWRLLPLTPIQLKLPLPLAIPTLSGWSLSHCALCRSPAS